MNGTIHGASASTLPDGSQCTIGFLKVALVEKTVSNEMKIRRLYTVTDDGKIGSLLNGEATLDIGFGFGQVVIPIPSDVS